MYYIFGVLFVVYGILVVTCAEITIVLVYFQLCSEDYRWWWRAFFTSGSSALYLFLYSAFYFVTKLEITKLVSTLMYFGKHAVRYRVFCGHSTDSLAVPPGYMLILSVSFFLMTGAQQPPARTPHANRAEGVALSRRHCGLLGVLAVRARHLWEREDRLIERATGARAARSCANNTQVNDTAQRPPCGCDSLVAQPANPCPRGRAHARRESSPPDVARRCARVRG